MYTAAGVKEPIHRIEDYVPLVKRIAHHMMARLPSSVQLDDLVQAGMIGLLDAINRFSAGQGAQFETYAAQRIRGAMLDELRGADWLPRGVRRNLRRIENAMAALEQRLKRAPTEAELARELGISLADYQNMLSEGRGHPLVSYDDLDEDRGDFLDRHMAASGHSPLDDVINDETRRRLVTAIDELPEREKLIMAMYYEQEMNLREIGAVLGVSESRVCQIHTQAIARLRGRLRAR